MCVKAVRDQISRDRHYHQALSLFSSGPNKNNNSVTLLPHLVKRMMGLEHTSTSCILTHTFMLYSVETTQQDRVLLTLLHYTTQHKALGNA